jgi:hypothetical protein
LTPGPANSPYDWGMCSSALDRSGRQASAISNGTAARNIPSATAQKRRDTTVACRLLQVSGAATSTRSRFRGGARSLSRQFTLPSDLPTGTYELTAEVWPANMVGKDGVETLADSTCEYVSIS